MSNRPSKKRSSSARVQAASKAGQSGSKTWIIITVAVVVVGAVVVYAIASSNSGGAGTNIAGRKDAPATLVKQVTTVPSTVITKVGAGSTVALPKPIDGKSIEVDGKPGVLYIGAEFCPYCATERWAMVNALSRFGTFTGLKITNSDPNDTPSAIRTLSFHGSTYTSSYIHFDGVETETNSRAALDTPTSDQQAIMTKFDSPPYVDSSSSQAIPFVYFNGEYMISGATYDVSVLEGKSWDQIASAMNDPSSAIAKGAIGAANGMTAAICLTTKDAPSNVCSVPAIQSLEKQIKAQPKASSSSSSGNSSTLNG